MLKCHDDGRVKAFTSRGHLRTSPHGVPSTLDLFYATHWSTRIASSEHHLYPMKRARAGKGEGAENCEQGRSAPEAPRRPGPAARKRELERQRRNLVSTRFLELDRALLAEPTASFQNGGAQPAKRIDKEAILKDATTRIVSQAAELTSANQRLTAMTGEVEVLRAEKVELRADKTYLHTELETVRSEVQRLRADNIHLWQAIRKSGSLKTALSTDVAKIPADILLRAQQANAMITSPPTVAVPDAVPTSNYIEDKDLSGGGQTGFVPQTSNLYTQGLGDTHCHRGESSPGGVDVTSQPVSKSARCSTVGRRPSMRPGRLEEPGSHPVLRCREPPLPASSYGAGKNGIGQRGELEATSLVDSFLVFQSPEDLGELFADCFDPSMTRVGEPSAPVGGVARAGPFSSASTRANVGAPAPIQDGRKHDIYEQQRLSQEQQQRDEQQTCHDHQPLRLLEPQRQDPSCIRAQGQPSQVSGEMGDCHLTRLQAKSHAEVHEDPEGGSDELLADVAYCA